MKHPPQPSCLIADDQPLLVRVLERRFSYLGYRVDTAHDFQTARELATLNRYEIALVDLNLTPEAEWEGLAVIELLRDHSPGAKVLLHTAEISPAIQREALRSGAFGCVVKPCGFAVIEEVLARPNPLPSVR